MSGAKNATWKRYWGVVANVSSTLIGILDHKDIAGSVVATISHDDVLGAW